MCGISGLVARSEDGAAGRIARMTAALAHRGPDGSGTVAAEGVHLGHRRLAVIDLSAEGGQPMCDEDGSRWITYNGELYGFADLRDRLLDRGHRFRSRTDTEVILHLYEEKGAACLDELNGMFAFGLHDRARKRLLLARDRLGIKPLFWAVVDGELLFASEVKAILAGLSQRPALRPEVLGQYLLQGYASAPDTLFQGIHALPPGHFLEIDLDAFRRDGRVPEPREYWDAPFTGDDDRPDAAIEAELEALLTESVALQQIADVPLGAFLSGGIDSSAVVALLARTSPRPIQTFTVDVPGTDRSEGEKAQGVAEALHTIHTRIDATATGADEYWPRLAHFDVPWNGSSLLNAWLISRATREKVTVALSGDGGDELFGGYDRYLHLSPAPSPAVQHLAGLGARLVPAGVRGRARLAGLAEDDFTRAFTARHPLSVTIVESLVGTSLAPWVERMRAIWERHPGDLLSRTSYLDLKSYLPDHVLLKVDNASMAVSLEVRVPLLDHRVVELAGRIPSRLKVQNGTGKMILLRLVGRWLPTLPAISTQGKTGFDLPLSTWLFERQLADRLAELSRLDARFRSLLDGRTVDRWIGDLRQGSRVRVPQRSALWAVYQLERWLALP
jgi:asparagine synthase (glutamine-hydrolysing)